MAKVNISVADDLLSRIDTEAKANYANRSQMIAMMAMAYFRSKDTLEASDKLLKAIEALKE